MSNKKEDLFGLNNDSEGEDVSLDEEEQEDSRFSKSRLQKHSLSDEDSVASEDSDDEEEKDNLDEEHIEEEEEAENNVNDYSEDEDDYLKAEGYDAPEDLAAFGAANKKQVKTTKKIKSLTPEELEKFEKARKKTGVCYLSRIPLFMKPSRVRSLLEKHAEIGRIYLVPEGNHKCGGK
jgi:ESF2/ABP1 family protein